MAQTEREGIPVRSDERFRFFAGHGRQRGEWWGLWTIITLCIVGVVPVDLKITVLVAALVYATMEHPRKEYVE